MSEANLAQLEEQISVRSREIKTDGYAMSIGEMMSMYRDDELDVHPEFQRIFRWGDEQKSRLIESILLGIPVPTIFVAQRDDGVWDVIDGVQRLSTILEFVGLYRSHEGTLLSPLTLEATEYLPDLAGFQWEVDPGDGRVFSEALRRDFKRSKLDFRIVMKESDDDAKYDLFQRLNSGTQLSPQEARNCLLVMLDPEYYRWMVALSGVGSFQKTVSLSERKEDEGFRQELVLRFVLHAGFGNSAGALPKELGEYVTDWMRDVAVSSTEASRGAVSELFASCFGLLDAALGDDAFRRYDADTARFLGAFSISAYEAITAGLIAHHSEWIDAPDELRARVQEMWASEDFRSNSGTGITARLRTPRLIQFGRAYFAHA